MSAMEYRAVRREKHVLLVTTKGGGDIVEMPSDRWHEEWQDQLTDETIEGELEWRGQS